MIVPTSQPIPQPRSRQIGPARARLRPGIHLLILISGLAAGCDSSAGGEFPSNPITFIVPYNPGGGTDASSRALAAALQEVIGRPVNVVNRSGGGGVVGHLALSRARPDGYTIGAMTVEITMLHWTGITPLTHADYTPLAVLVQNPAAITVRADAPWNTVGELIQAIRENPGTYRASGTSIGGIWDLARIGFLQSAGLEESALPWVPSQGSAPALQQLIAGGVHVVTAALVEVNALREAGQVKTLAVMSDERMARFPDVPTLIEQGVDYSLGGWIAVAAPAGLPDDVRNTLASAIEQAATDSSYVQSMLQAGFNLRLITADETEDFLVEEDRRNGGLLRSVNLAR